MSNSTEPASNNRPADAHTSSGQGLGSPAVSVLNSLANELLEGILSHLRCADLALASRVSRHLNTLAEPLLYRSVSLVSWSKPGPSPFHIIILTLLSRPLLANHVRYLFLSWHALPNICFGNDRSPRFPPGLRRLTAAAAEVGIDRPPRSDGAQVLLLLHLLPHLEVLDLTPPSEPDNFSTFLNDRDVFPTMPLPVALQSVREVHYYWSGRGLEWFDTDQLDPSILLVLFRLPAIRMLDVRFMCHADVEIDWTEAAYPVGSSTVTDLHFGYGDVTMYTFEKVLRIPRTLTHFSYGACSPGGRRFFDTRRFKRALETAKETLQSLVLCFSDTIDTDEEGVVGDSTLGIGSLRDWLALRSIRCSLSTLLGEGRSVGTLRLVDVLPVGIRELEVEMDGFWSFEETMEELVELVERKEESGIRNLQVLTVPHYWGVQEGLSVVCDAAGVALVRGSSEGWTFL